MSNLVKKMYFGFPSLHFKEALAVSEKKGMQQVGNSVRAALKEAVFRGRVRLPCEVRSQHASLTGQLQLLSHSREQA